MRRRPDKAALKSLLERGAGGGRRVQRGKGWEEEGGQASPRNSAAWREAPAAGLLHCPKVPGVELAHRRAPQQFPPFSSTPDQVWAPVAELDREHTAHTQENCAYLGRTT